MFFSECERLANKQPGLRELIRRIDEILRSVAASSLLRPSDIASYLCEEPSKVLGIFEKLTKEGLLREEKYIECTKCSGLMNFVDYKRASRSREPFECTQCQDDLTMQRPDEVTAYRLNPAEVQSVQSGKEPVGDAFSCVPQGFYEELSPQILKAPFRSTPLLRYYSRVPDSLNKRPLRGVRGLFVLHFLKDLIPFVKACEAAGLNMRNAYFFYKDYQYPQREAIKKWLEDQGAVVGPLSYIPQYLEQLGHSPSNRVGRILIAEDGGFIVPAIHEKFAGLVPSVIGAVEQTTRGTRNAEKLGEVKFPLVSVATCNLKREFEPKHIATAVVDNIKRLLPSISLPGKTVALFGCGTIGKEIANWLRQNGVNVTIYDPRPESLLWARERGYNAADAPAQAVRDKNFVVGASGEESINSDVISSLSHGTHLVSASSELYEIDMQELERLQESKNPLISDSGAIIGTTFVLPPNSRQVHVLANGYPINFWGSESMPEEAADLILSLLFLSLLEIALGNYSAPGISEDAADAIVDKYQIAKKFLQMHKHS